MKVTVISEFAENAFDNLVSSVCWQIHERYPGSFVILVAGFLKRYVYGGWRPLRLLNYFVVYARTLVRLVTHRPEIVIVDSTPPLIQWWAIFLGRLVRARVYFWLMDYHPEIEARYLDSCPGGRWLAKLLRAVDRALLKRLSGVVTLDEAMAQLVRSRCVQLDVKVHPTWSKQGTGEYQPVALNSDQTEFRLVYVGNLGAAHGLDRLEILLGQMRSQRSLRLMIAGGNLAGLARWRDMADRVGAKVENEGRLDWPELHRRLNDFRPNYAVVLLDENKAGLLSPSKFTTYLQLGLPILYLGPRLTNTDAACRAQGAGLAVTREEFQHDSEAVVRSLFDPVAQERRRLATKAAYGTLASLSEYSFVEMIQPWLVEDTTQDSRP